MILDGWGHSPDPKVSAIDHANTPFIDSLYKNYPNAELRTDGLNVGLPEGQMGNSEVGHMNLGAGRIIFQELTRINLAVQNKTLNSEKVLQEAFEYAKKNRKDVHFLGLVSDGGVHSHIDHLKGLVNATQDFGIENVYIHAFTDGRDVDPKSGVRFISELENYCKNTTAKLATIIGRYYAMDRDRRWERVKLAYDLLVNGIGTHSQNAVDSIQGNYANDITDEFIQPIVMVDENDQPLATLKNGDVVIFFNFRTDRGRQLTEVLTQFDCHEQNMHQLDLYYVTLTNYDETYKNIKVIYNKDNTAETLGEILERNHKKQIRIAETEKYPHVTFFFSGGREEPFEGETRILRNSPKVATYDLKPEMSAQGIADAICEEMKKDQNDFICLNFANPDMVGHTGVFSAVIKAVETVDKCAEQVVNTGLEHGYSFIIIADHGNADFMINEDGSPNTAHSTNLVPCILINNNEYKLRDGGLADIAPSILELFGIDKPQEMNGESLLVKA